jgi:hypothetical protein
MRRVGKNTSSKLKPYYVRRAGLLNALYDIPIFLPAVWIAPGRIGVQRPGECKKDCSPFYSLAEELHMDGREVYLI